jgi:hypothetical protein
MSALGQNVHAVVEHNGHITHANYVEDGRPCEFVELQELQHGDVILGWNGEPFDFGAVDHVETFMAPSYGPAGPTKRWVVHMDDGRQGNPLVGGENLRRIAPRKVGAPVHTITIQED